VEKAVLATEIETGLKPAIPASDYAALKRLFHVPKNRSFHGTEGRLFLRRRRGRGFSLRWEECSPVEPAQEFSR